MVGFSADGDQEVLRGDMGEHKFAVFYLKNGAVVAADAVNSPKEFMACKQMIGKLIDPLRLADPACDLKSLLT
jgi:3-phenylpropionate/trans-cinnamate dioxygenase ferredoxin reductase subunit